MTLKIISTALIFMAISMTSIKAHGDNRPAAYIMIVELSVFVVSFLALLISVLIEIWS